MKTAKSFKTFLLTALFVLSLVILWAIYIGSGKQLIGTRLLNFGKTDEKSTLYTFEGPEINYNLPVQNIGESGGGVNTQRPKSPIKTTPTLPPKPTIVPKSPIILNTDIVIYGGGLSGASAAIQAARMGHSVIVVEPTHMLGGQASSAGVSQFDMGVDIREYGLVRELIDAIKTLYGSNIAFKIGCHNNPNIGNEKYGQFCPSPKKVHEGFVYLINKNPAVKNKIRILYNTEALSLQKKMQNNIVKVTGLVAKSWQTGQQYNINAKIVIDASEYGDLIPHLGVRFFAGWPDTPYTNIAQVQNSNACIDKITHTAFIRDTRVVPDSLGFNYSEKVPRPIGFTDTDVITFVRKVVPYGQTPADGITYTDRSYSDKDPTGTYYLPWSFRLHTTYRSIVDKYVKNPDAKHPTKTGLNYANDYPVAQKVGVHAKYLVDKNYRKQVNCSAKAITYKFVYYLTYINKVKKQNNKYTVLYSPNTIPWNLSKEEGFCDETGICYSLSVENCSQIPDTVEKYMATIPYVRESLRIYGRSIPKAVDNGTYDIKDGLLRWYTVERVSAPTGLGIRSRIARHNILSAVSIADYGFDRHGCYGYGPGVPSAEQTKSGLFQIPLGAYIPSGVQGFLVAEKNLAVDHFVQGAVRVHGPTILSGQVVGIISHNLLTPQVNLDPTRLSLTKIQEQVVNSKGKISRLIFRDVSVQNTTLYKYAELMSAWDILRGSEGRFYPAMKANRAQIATVLVRLMKSLGIPITYSTTNVFSDVPDNYAHTQNINTIFKYKVTSGYYYNPDTGERRFCPARVVRMQEYMALLSKMFKNNKGQLRAVPNNCTQVVLPKDTSSWAKLIIEEAVKQGAFSVINQNGTCRVRVLTLPVAKCDYNNPKFASCMTAEIDRLQLSAITWDFIKNTYKYRLSE